MLQSSSPNKVYATLLFSVLALTHFYTAYWFDGGMQHDPAIHFSVLRGVVSFDLFPYYNSIYYYTFVGILTAPFAALYRMHLINDVAYLSMAASWSGFVISLIFVWGCVKFARVLRFQPSEQFLFAAFFHYF